MSATTEYPDVCSVCAERDATIVDSEQGAICMSCHDDLAAVEGALGAFSLPICTTAGAAGAAKDNHDFPHQKNQQHTRKMTMTKEEKMELKGLRKRLKELNRDTAKEAAKICGEENVSERDWRRVQRDADAVALRKMKAVTREMNLALITGRAQHRAEMRALAGRRKLADKNGGETKAVMDRIAVLEGRLSA